VLQRKGLKLSFQFCASDAAGKESLGVRYAGVWQGLQVLGESRKAEKPQE
jgi:hypothetical protein